MEFGDLREFFLKRGGGGGQMHMPWKKSEWDLMHLLREEEEVTAEE